MYDVNSIFIIEMYNMRGVNLKSLEANCNSAVLKLADVLDKECTVRVYCQPANKQAHSISIQTTIFSHHCHNACNSYISTLTLRSLQEYMLEWTMSSPACKANGYIYRHLLVDRFYSCQPILSRIALPAADLNSSLAPLMSSCCSRNQKWTEIYLRARCQLGSIHTLDKPH